MIKEFYFGKEKRIVHCYHECPDVAGIELQTIVNSALRQLNKLLDDTYNVYKTKYQAITRPNLYAYICESNIKEVNAFTDGVDIYISVACMISMHSYIKERLNTDKFNGEKLLPVGLEQSSEIRIYKNILELIVAHELAHIWHRHGVWKKSALQAETLSTSNYEDTVFSETVIVNGEPDMVAEGSYSVANLVSINGKILLNNPLDPNYIQQILEVDADCCAVQIVLMHLQREVDSIVQKNLCGTEDENKKEIRAIISYHSYLIGLLMGAAGIMCGFFDSQRLGKPFDRLSVLLLSGHPVPAIRFIKMHETLLGLVHQYYSEETVADILLSQTSAFAIDIFMHDGTSKDLKNCFWAPAQTKEAQEFISYLEQGWNLIRDSLQQYALVDLPHKYPQNDMIVDSSMIWYDKYGNSLRP